MMKNDLLMNQIYEDYYQKVFSYLRSHVQNYHDAEDLCEEVFTKVFKKMDTFDEQKSSLSTWIFNITKNTLIDAYRTKRDTYEMIDNYEYLTDTQELSKEDILALRDALTALSEEERELIILRYYEGYTLKEISQKMSLSYGITKLRHNDALERIKEYLE